MRQAVLPLVRPLQSGVDYVIVAQPSPLHPSAFSVFPTLFFKSLELVERKAG